jgi:thiosulfate reductase cytochrome b subunit
MTAPQAPPPVVRQVKRHHWIVRLTHWLTFVLLLGMIASGLQIYAAYARFGERGGPYYVNPFQNRAFPEWSRLGGWLAGALNWHFALMWPLIIAGVLYVSYLVASGEWRSLVFRPRDIAGAIEMQKYYLRLRKDHPPQGKHNPLQKLAYTCILLLGVLSVLTGFAIYKPTQLSWLTALFGGFQAARYWHFWTVWIFTGFLVVHVILVFVVDPASLRAMISGWYRGRFPSHD